MITVINKTKELDGRLRITVSVNGTNRDYYADNIDSLKAQIRADVRNMQNIDTLDSSVSSGQIDITEATNQPTQAEIDRQTYFNDLSKLRVVSELVSLGVLTGSEQAVITLRNKVKNEFKVEYLDS